MLLLLLAALALGIWAFVGQVRAGNDAIAVGLMVGNVVIAFLCAGFFVVHPNEGKVLTLFGRYVGSVREPGLWWVNPFTAKHAISLRIRNFETQKLKVNDSHSNPIEIAAVVVWKVVDTAEAMFEVDDYEHYVKVQSESAMRTLATSYPYDAHSADEVSLVGNPKEVVDRLRTE